jgi:tyrosyl-tRNA synthetase
MTFGIEEQIAVFQSRTVDLVSAGELAAKLGLGRPLRIKYGCDPSAPDLHLAILFLSTSCDSPRAQ